jgi:hypothetical protein
MTAVAAAAAAVLLLLLLWQQRMWVATRRQRWRCGDGLRTERLVGLLLLLLRRCPRALPLLCSGRERALTIAAAAVTDAADEELCGRRHEWGGSGTGGRGRGRGRGSGARFGQRGGSGCIWRWCEDATVAVCSVFSVHSIVVPSHPRGRTRSAVRQTALAESACERAASAALWSSLTLSLPPSLVQGSLWPPVAKESRL